jgi:hypothetical protein
MGNVNRFAVEKNYTEVFAWSVVRGLKHQVQRLKPPAVNGSAKVIPPPAPLRNGDGVNE